MLRKVIKITAWDSPNVRLAQREIAEGRVPSGRIVTPGVLTWERLQTYLKIWDADLQKIKLRAEFPEGSSVLMFPPEWLEHAGQTAFDLQQRRQKRVARAMGIDSGQGSANTAWVVGDELGVLEGVAERTPNTAVIPRITVDLQRRWGVPTERIVFDAGGGGLEHCDRLRTDLGWRCRAVSFGETVSLDIKRGLTLIEDRRHAKEQRQSYVNRRAEMHDRASQLMNPRYDEQGKPTAGYGVPSERNGGFWARLAECLRPIPKLYDDRERIYLPSKEQMAQEFYGGRSPDESDAFVLMIHALTHRGVRTHAGVV